MNKRITGTAALLAWLILMSAGCHVMRTAPSPSAPTAPAPATARADTMTPSPERSPVAPPGEGKVALVVAFAWAEGAADDIRRSFTYSARQAYPPYQVETVRCWSAYETVTVCDSIMQRRDIRLVVFAGDEGPAVSVALLAEKHRVPVLKLTSDTRSCAGLSDFVVEFLASGQRQAEILGQFAVQEMRLEQFMILHPADARGQLLATAFREGVEKKSGRVDLTDSYDPDAANVRPDLARMFADERRIAAGRVPIRPALTAEERAEAFGDAQSGEVLFSGTADSGVVGPPQGEGLFLVVSPDKVESYIPQLSLVPSGTALLGNSSWVTCGAPASYTGVIEGMHIVAPMLPHAADDDALVSGYLNEQGGDVNEWELLGLDAGEFVGRVMANSHERQDVLRVISRMPRFAGRAVEVDFGGSHENRLARVLRCEDGTLVPAR